MHRSALVHYSQKLTDFFVQKPFAGTVGLNPAAIDDELRDGALAGVTNDLVSGAGRGFNIDVCVGNVVFVEEALGGAAIGAP